VDGSALTNVAVSGANVSGNIAGNAANVTGTVAIANGGTGATTAANARTNLGLGSAATLTAGTSASNVVQLDGSGKLPAVDGSALTNLATSAVNWAVPGAIGSLTPNTGAFTTLATSGNVGIGTASPNYLLDVFGSGATLSIATPDEAYTSA